MTQKKISQAKKVYTFKGHQLLGDALKIIGRRMQPEKTPSLYISDLLEAQPEVQKELQRLSKNNSK